MIPVGIPPHFLKRFQISSLDELPDYDEMLKKIKQMNGGDSNYLYKKDVYDEKNDPEHTDAEKKSGEPDGENGDLVDAEAKPVENADENVEPVNTEEENISEPSAGDYDGVDEESVDEESEKSAVPDFLRTKRYLFNYFGYLFYCVDFFRDVALKSLSLMTIFFGASGAVRFHFSLSFLHIFL